MNTLIVLPARNEERQIGMVLDSIKRYHRFPVLVIDDHSSDSTAAIAASRAGVSVIRLPFWMGYGGALQVGYKYALIEGYDSVVQMDADGQHDPAFISALIERLNVADVVVGSRFLHSQEPYVMSSVRRLGCLLLSWIAKRLTGMTITDPTSGFQALGRNALSIAAQDHFPRDYPDIDVLILMHRFRLRVAEVAVRMHPSPEKPGMHEGLQVWYYAVKMILSIFVTMLRKA